MATVYDPEKTPAALHGVGNRPGSRFPKWLVRTLACVVAAFGVGLIVLAINWPFTRQALIDTMQKRSVRSVTIDHFRVTYFPPGCVAEGVKFLRRKYKEKPPLITISKVEVKGSYWGMISLHKRLSAVRIYGMHVTVPPSDPNGAPNPVMPVTASESGRSLIIGTVIADGAILDFVQRTPGTPPLRLVVNKLTLDGVGNNHPMKYRAMIHNPAPPGFIESGGQFGTWDSDAPARTAVKGWYRYSHADLGAFKAITGVLTSSGNFDGILGRISVRGGADVPDFHVAGSSHTRDLAAQFAATVNATDGNVSLNDVVARFDRTEVHLNGAIEGHPGKDGKAVELRIRSLSGRIEDLLNLFIAGDRAPLSGNVNLEAQVDVPAGSQSFLTGMKVQGSFGVGSGKFVSREIQSSLSRISNDASKKDRTSPESSETLVSSLNGKVTVENGVANLVNLSLRVPGAEASLDGTYNLVDYRIDLHGRLVTDGSASAATTGIKSFMLKAMTPFLKKEAGRQTIPFKITGNYRNAQLGLDIGHKQ